MQGIQGPKGDPGVSTKVNGIAPDETGNVTLTAADVGALPSAGGSMTGGIDMGGNGLSNVADPAHGTDAVNLRTVKSREPDYVNTEIPASWSGTAPYTVTVAVQGVSAVGGDVHIYPVYSANVAERTAQREAYNAITLVTPGENQITFTCDEDKPAVAIPIKVEVRKV